MELVGARFEGDIYLRAAAPPKGGIVGAGQDFKLADRVHGRIDGEGIELGVPVVNTVEDEIIGVFAGPVDIDRELPAHGTRGARRGRRRPGNEKAQLQEIAPIEGKPRDLLVLYDKSDARRVQLDEALQSRDHNLLRWRARLESDVVSDFLPDSQDERFPHVLSKSATLSFESIGSRLQHGERILALRPSQDLPLLARLFVNQGNLDTGYRRTGFLRHDTANCGSHGLG